MDTLEKLKQIFTEKGYKLTPHREVILELFYNSQDKHLSGEDVFAILNRRRSSISKATVYRTLLTLEKAGLLTEVSFGDGFTRYELNNPGERHFHHHLICTGCGAISEVKSDMLEGLETQVYIDGGFKVKNHVVKLYGHCKNCNI